MIGDFLNYDLKTNHKSLFINQKSNRVPRTGFLRRSAYGRTRVSAVKGQRPKPLDERGK